ncbi:MAG TPA: DNA mismatch repair protein MutS [Verrucomicrobiales bacterium]|nr:DNA mismatch repair protein MutS [Verrucomicrobiales bacterium]
MAGSSSSTPMMRQYHRLRRELPPDVLLLFRLGDFYEMFFEDAKAAAAILDLALTKRNGIPMCGVPHHSAEGYIGRLIKAGRRVAIAEQTSEPKPGRLVDREISQIISAGTVSDLNLLESDRANYLAAVCRIGRRYGLACVDLSTGEFRATEFSTLGALQDELERLAPSELLRPDDQDDLAMLSHALSYDGYHFLANQAAHVLREHFRVQSLDGFGCAGLTAAVGAAGAVMSYLQHQLRRDVSHVRRLRRYEAEDFVLIDAASQRNLELVNSRAGSEFTLLRVLDRTSTPMGARRLHHWLLHPLRDLQALRRRQALIQALLDEPYLLNQCRESLKEVRDIERTLGRLSQGAGNGRDLRALGQSLKALPGLRTHLEALAERSSPELAAALASRLPGFPELVDLLDRAIVDEPPATIRDGGIFRDGYLIELDEMRSGSREGKQWIADLQTREAKRTGIRSLKVRFNAVFGYYIEVTRSNLEQVPDDYQRRQTLANAERFVTPELKEMENRILGADERSRIFEYEEFLRLRERVLVDLEAMQDAASAVASVDVICGLAETARLYDYTRPVLTDSLELHIEEGRHPVLDQAAADEKFVPNDTFLEPEENRLLLITGPNMAGKSTYIRQVALITLMAQMGGFVPARSAQIGLVDRIFTRVGANDDLSRGQSTFMVEMNETALILNHATERSLVILDEIGRGTSTFDGLSIAWSVAEHLHDVIRARTLFATHYHELTALAKGRQGVKNYNVAVREWNEEVIFLRRIVAGAADRSYGIQVARLAGLPQEIISRAREILDHLERNASQPKSRKGGKESRNLLVSDPPQLDLFG